MKGLDSDNDNDKDIDIEQEFRGVQDPVALNSRFASYRRALNEKESVNEMDSEKETVYDVDNNNTVYEEEQEEDEAEAEEEQPPYYEQLLRVAFKALYKVKHHWRRAAVLLALLLVNLAVMLSMVAHRRDASTSQSQSQSQSQSHSHSQVLSINTIQDVSTSLTNLQWQINELNTKNKHRLNDFKNYLDLKLDEFNTRFQRLDARVDEWDARRLRELDLSGVDVVNAKVPILLDEYNNVKILPEFEQFLRRYINSYLNNVDFNAKFEVDYDALISRHLDKLAQGKMGFMRKEEVLSLVSSQLQENKAKLIQDIKNQLLHAASTTTTGSSSSSKEDVSDRLVTSGYRAEEDARQVNYALFTAGARIINYLTSPTFEPKLKRSGGGGGGGGGKGLLQWLYGKREGEGEGQGKGKEGEEGEDKLLQLEQPYSSSPFIVLTSNEGYWRSSAVNDTRLAIKFLEPIYLNRVEYKHGNVLNGAVLTSAPRKMSLFINTYDNARNALLSEYRETLPLQDQDDYFKVSEMEYSIEQLQEQQFFEIGPKLSKVLVKSVLIRVESNQGNAFFTSINKFVIQGLTRFDVYSIKELLNSDSIDSALKAKFKAVYNM
jgi:hypothetical protein